MKKIIIFILIQLIFVNPAIADEINIFVGNGSNYSEIMEDLVETQFRIRYDTDDDQYYFHSKDYLSTGWIYLSYKDIEKLKYILQKYLEWEDIAIKNETQIKKEIPDSEISGKLAFLYGDEWYTAHNIELNFHFFSGNTEVHFLIISSNKVNSTKNQFIDYKLDPIYLSHEQALQFLEGISENAINKTLSDYEKNKETEKLFK